MPVLIDTLEIAPAPAPEKPSAEKVQASPTPPPPEAMEIALERLEEREARVWAH